MFKKKKFPNFKDIESLRGKNVCWIRGYDFDNYIEVPMHKHERNNRKSILQSLQKDRFGFFIDDKDDMQEGIDKAKFNSDAYSFVKILKFDLIVNMGA